MGRRLQKVWFFNKCLAVCIIFLFNGFVYSPVVCADDTDDDLIFIHHSVGKNWLSHSLHNALLAKSYIDERNDIYYDIDVLPDSGRPDSLAPIPGDKTSMHHWILWFNDYLDGIKNHGCADGFNKIIMFKSCYPNSNIESDGTEPGDPFSDTKTVVNYKAVYRHPSGPGNTYSYGGYIYYPLEDIFAANPDILFIPITAPPLVMPATTLANAQRARQFNDWLTNTWLNSFNNNNPGLNNVAPYYWFDLLAYPVNHPDYPNILQIQYRTSSTNSHPNGAANAASTVEFATASDNFIDTAWNAFTDSVPVPNLVCSGSLEGTDVEPGKTVEGSFTVENIGESSSLLDWEVAEYPDWGIWTFIPSSGDDLKPEDGVDTVEVSVIAPDEKNSEFSGEVRIVNKENIADSCTIPVYIKTPIYKPFIFNLNLLSWLFERFPHMFPILRNLLGL